MYEVFKMIFKCILLGDRANYFIYKIELNLDVSSSSQNTLYHEKAS